MCFVKEKSRHVDCYVFKCIQSHASTKDFKHFKTSMADDLIEFYVDERYI